MSDKQGLVSVTMVNKPEQSISRIEREKKLQLTVLALLLELCTCKKTDKKDKKIHRIHVTQRRKER